MHHSLRESIDSIESIINRNRDSLSVNDFQDLMDVLDALRASMEKHPEPKEWKEDIIILLSRIVKLLAGSDFIDRFWDVL